MATLTKAAGDTITQLIKKISPRCELNYDSTFKGEAGDVIKIIKISAQRLKHQEKEMHIIDL